jgi:crotonobetainyl-CoA:carnitine CoA-transferase CaiB-like acyl-CoA transferase
MPQCSHQNHDEGPVLSSRGAWGLQTPAPPYDPAVQSPEESVGPLQGIRVIEAGLLVQGPQAAETLHDWGADVVKVELPGFGDQSRWLPVAPGDSRSAYFIACNRGKRSVTIDMRVPAGREVFLRLAGGADVVITNFKPGTMESWGLGYDDLAARNPRLVYATGSSFGPVGPDAAREGADLSGQASGGLISTTGWNGGPLTPVGATVADHIASQNMVSGILAALIARDRTGVGQRLDVSLLGGQIWAQASELTACILTGAPVGQANGGNPLIPGIYGIFPTADGWLGVIGVAGAARTRFYEVIGRPELAELFPQLLYSEDDKAKLFPMLGEVFSTRSTAEWCKVLGEAGLRFAPVRDHSEVLADPGAWDNGYFRSIPGASGEEVTVPGSPVRFSATPARAAALAPELGQHTEEVLLELGYSWEEIARLAEQDAV